MKWTRRMCCAMAWAVILAVSTLAAPVIQTHPKDSTKQQIEAQSTDTDSTAKELESLSQNAASQPQAAPAQNTEDLQSPAEPPQNTDHKSPQASQQTSPQKPVEESKTAQSQEEPDVINAPMNFLPTKRQLPSFDKNVFPDPRSFAAFPQRAEEAPQFEGDYPSLQSEVDNTVYSDEPQIDLSPRAVAEYLLVTKDFDGLEQALSDLVQSGVLSPDEVYQYKETVSVTYDDLLRRVETPEYVQNVDPLEYLERQGQLYPENALNQNSIPVQNMAYADLGIPSSDLSQYQAIPIAERRTERVQKLLLAKQQTLDGILDVVLNEYYNRPQEYMPQNVEPANPGYAIEEDTDLDQLMDYLQEALKQDKQEEYDESVFQPAEITGPQEGAEEAAPANEATETEDSSENGATNQVENELNSLSTQQGADVTEDTDSVEETSGDEENKAVNDTKVQAPESS